LAEQYPDKQIHAFEDVQALQHWLKQHPEFPQAGSTVLLKSSHGTGLHVLTKMLRGREQHVI